MARRVGELVGTHARVIVIARRRRAQCTAHAFGARHRQRRALGLRIDEAARVGLHVAPCAEDAERKPRLQHHAPEGKPSAVRSRHREDHLGKRRGGHVDHHLRARFHMARKDGRTIEPGARVEVDAELRRLAGKHRLGAPYAHRHARQIARRVHHAGESHAGEEEGEREAEREGVVDRADEQDGERQDEEPAELCRHDVDAPVHEQHHAALRRREAVEPVGEPRPALEQRVDHPMGPLYFQRPRHADSTRLGYSGWPSEPL